MDKRGWESCDFVYVCGDAYVDHPSFGHAIISRILEAHGYKVGIIAQPDWKNPESIQILGEPRLGWLVSAGNMDSMVNHYSVSKKRRAKDSYTPGGEMGKRPDYATIVYSNLIRTWSKKPIILGGIEASLRRLAHYDYWSGKMKRSILLDSQADLISYGMGERSIVEIADALASGIEAKDITFIEGTVYKAENLDSVYDEIRLPSYREVSSDKKTYAESFYTQYSNTDPFSGKRLVEPYRPPLCGPESGGETTDPGRDGRCLRTSIHENLASVLRCSGWYSSDHGSKIQPDQQPRMLRRMQLLCADLPSGTHRADPQP